MTPSPTEILEVAGVNLGNEKAGIVKLLPVEAVPQGTDGLDYFKRHNVLPTGGFYFPETRLGTDQVLSHVSFVEKLLHDAAHQYQKSTKQLRDLYGTTLQFDEDDLSRILLKIDSQTVSLTPFLKTGDNISQIGHDLSLGPLYALLALDSKSQRLVFEAAEHHMTSQFDFKTGVRDGTKPERMYLAHYGDSFPLEIEDAGRNQYAIVQFDPRDSLRKDKPFFVAVSGPAPTFAEFIKGLRGK